MSQPSAFPTEIPETTRQLVEALLDEASVYRLIGEQVEQMVGDADFAGMYAEEGRPGVNGVVLALITVFQFLEKLPDRAAARMAVLRLDWKYALRQEGGFCNSPRKGKFEKLFRITMRFLGYLTEVTIDTGFRKLIIVHQGFDECALLSSCLKLSNLGWV